MAIENDMRAAFFGPQASTRPTIRALSAKLGARFHLEDIDIRDFAAVQRVFRRLCSRKAGRAVEEVPSAASAGARATPAARTRPPPAAAKEFDLDCVIHCAAQPSHDWAAREPLSDFGVNAVGTVNLLELTRQFAPNATFIFCSTNKVYGDRVNISFETGVPAEDYRGMVVQELATRFEAFLAGGDELLTGVDETMPVDGCKHSIFGCSKLAADVMVQEYGRYFGMNTVCFRGGCLTGPDHAGCELHGFLSHLMKCIVSRKPYTIYGYKGKQVRGVPRRRLPGSKSYRSAAINADAGCTHCCKDFLAWTQVRDNIHSLDLVRMFWAYHQCPRPGEVYNAGGGRANSISIIEAIVVGNELLGIKQPGWEPWSNYTIREEPRSGDHIWYITDSSKFERHYPEWTGIQLSLREIISQILDAEIARRSDAKASAVQRRASFT